MEINPSNAINGQVQGLETTPKAGQVKREKEEAPEQHAAQAEEGPDYRIRLSDASKHAVTELTGSQSAGQSTETADLSDEQAAQLAQQVSEELSQTHAAISNQAMQNAVDLFT